MTDAAQIQKIKKWHRSHPIASKLVKTIGIFAFLALVGSRIWSFAENAFDRKELKVAMIAFGIERMEAARPDGVIRPDWAVFQSLALQENTAMIQLA